MFINGVLGPVNTSAMGQTLMHEHVTCADWSMRMNFGTRFFDREKVMDSAKHYFGQAKELGVRTVVDGTPVNLGRDIRLIRDVAEATGLNFIASSGFYYQEEPWLQSRSSDELYELLAGECKYGLQDTDILPGIMKCACDKSGVTSLMEKILTATGRAAVEFDLPVFCHTAPLFHSADGAIDILIGCGVPPERIIAGHSGDSDDVEYLESLIKRGVYLGMDRFGMSDYAKPPYDLRGIELVAELIKRGWSKQLILSHDTAAYLAFGVEDEPGWENKDDMLVFSRIHKVIIPALEAKGIPGEQIYSMLIDNPRNFFEGNRMENGYV